MGSPEHVGRYFLGLAGVFVWTLAAGLALLAVVPALVLGWRPVVVSSGSMAPAIEVGDVVLAAPVDATTARPGSVVVFRDPGRGDLVTHRVRARNAEGRLVTKGDANLVADSTPLEPRHVIGQGRVIVPLAGRPALWLRQGEAHKVAALLGVLVLAMWTSRFALLARYNPWRAGNGVDVAAASPAPGPLVLSER